MVVFQVGCTTLQLEELQCVLERRNKLSREQDGGHENGGIGLSVDAMHDDDVLRILKQKF